MSLAGFAEQAGAEGPVAVEGGRTRWSRGGPLASDARLVRAPSGIVEHRPEEMTVTVRAGTTVADLHAELATTGQRTALPDRGGSVGGALAVGEDDVCVLGRGRVRNAVLQLRYVSAEGRIVTGGGPTVKNVSGFDLPRVMVGSLGTLGLFAEAILRTNPIPEVAHWFVAEDADPFAVCDLLYRPSAVLTDGARTWVQLEGYAPDVEEQRRRLAEAGAFAETDGPPELPPHRWPLSRAQLRGLDPGPLGRWVASAAVGTVFAEQPPPGPAAAPAPDPAVRRLAERVKAAFDPTGRLNPGRDPAAP